MKKAIIKKGLALGLVGCATLSVASCGKKSDTEAFYTYRTTTTVSPSNWNELTYQDSNDTQIMEYIGGSFFEFDYKRDSDNEIIDGAFKVNYSGATNLTDVTSTYAGNAKYNVPAGETQGYAYKITLRDDLKWDDGSAIKASDFVYTMKEQLDPAAKHYRADSYYNGSVVISGARDYFYQGSYGYNSMVSEDFGADEYVPANGFTKNAAGNYTVDGKDVVIDLESGGNWGGSLKGYFDEYPQAYKDEYNKLAGSAKDSNGKVLINDTTVVYVQNLIAILHGKANVAEYAAAAGEYAYREWQEMGFYGANYPEKNFDSVGLFATSDNELVVVLDKTLNLLNSDGSLNYQAAYAFNSLPVVKQDLWEANKHASSASSTLVTSTYNSSVTSTASWGPYKLTQYQAGKYYQLERNPYWYGNNMDLYEGQYQTDMITCETIAAYDTTLMKFKAGEIDDIGVDVSVASDYKNGGQTVFTPSSYVGSLQLQSDVTALKANQTTGNNKAILAYSDFRKALSLSIDRVQYNNSCTTSSQKGFGIFNQMHYYDVENGGVYRNTDAAKQALCKAYGVNCTDADGKLLTGDALNAVYKTITGYDLTQARELFNSSYAQALADGEIKASDNILLKYGTAEDSEATRRNYNWLVNAWTEAVKGTNLEGKLKFEFDASYGDKWSTSFRNGEYELCQGGWTGAAWNPGYFLLAYLSPDYMYSKAWDTSAEQLTFTMPGQYITKTAGGATEGQDYTATKSLLDWYGILNGDTKYALNWAAGAIADDARCLLIAALETAILEKYYTVPMSYQYSASMISYKIEYASRDYNTFMAYGGVRYMTYHFSDSEWASYVKKNGNTLDYTK